MSDPSKTPPVEAEPTTKADVKKKLDELYAKLRRMEGQKRSGAHERGPRARMLDASALEEKDSDHHYRYENTDNAGKMQVMIDDGYVAVPAAECEASGVRAEVGETRLIRIPREKHEEEVRRQHELHESRLKAHKTEVRQAVEAVQRELRDKHGIDVPLSRLLVDE